jgi:uncharacterized membrane protein
MQFLRIVNNDNASIFVKFVCMRYSFNIIALILVLFLASCKHDIINTPDISGNPTVVVTPPVGGGTSSQVSDTVCFNTEVLPLYASYCGSSGCHDVNSHRSGVILTDYSHIMNGIRAKLPNSSSYYMIIGGSMPPRNSPQMTAANLATIKKWIEQGAINTQCSNVCDTTVFTYSGAVQTIIANNCGGCHGSKPGTANVYLGDYTSAKTYITANATLFNNAINWTASTASKNMPQSGKMVACKITQIQKWIKAGYPQ